MADTDPDPATLSATRERIGFVVATFSSGGWDDLASGDILYDDLGDAQACCGEALEYSAKAGREDRHVVAEVFEVPDSDVTVRALAGEGQQR